MDHQLINSNIKNNIQQGKIEDSIDRCSKNDALHVRTHGSRSPYLWRAPGVMDGPREDNAALAVDDHRTVVVGDGGCARDRRGGDDREQEEEGHRDWSAGHCGTTSS